jgi:hypothetical protein
MKRYRWLLAIIIVLAIGLLASAVDFNEALRLLHGG